MTGDDKTPAKSRRWLVWGLVVSVAFNLFLAGFVGTRLWQERQNDVPLGPLARVMHHLPRETREQVRDKVDAVRPQLREAARELRQARGRAMNALTAEPFDRAAADTAFADVRRRSERMSAIYQSAMIEAAIGLGPDARRSLHDMRPRFGQRPNNP
jgi:uncharacterized membrane protein